MKQKSSLAILAAFALCGGAVLVHFVAVPARSPLLASSAPTRPDPSAEEPVDPKLVPRLERILSGYREIIVLFTGEKALSPVEREAGNQVGRAIYYENQARLSEVDSSLNKLAKSSKPDRIAALDRAISWIESGPGLFDADRLAFRETLRSLQKTVAQDPSLPGVKLHQRISEDLTSLDEIERLYDKELKRVFARFGERAIAVERQRWNDYVANLKRLFRRDQILKDYGKIVPYPAPGEVPDDSKEITGAKLPAKVLVLTFDDGPHGTYTEEIAAVLKQYGVGGIFFELGRNLGTVGPDGTPKLGRLAQKSKELIGAGFVLGNHSYSHLNLSKHDDATLAEEVGKTDALLKAVGAAPSHLFRFPYGARTASSLSFLDQRQLRPVFWNVDSLDWADPVPNSIADRVLEQIERQQRGIVLFHDINARTVKVLPLILDRLLAEGYRFATWDGDKFQVRDPSSTDVAKEAPTTGYQDSWAVVIGVDDYRKWPKLRYAVRDADAVKQTLVGRLGFADNHVFILRNEEATRGRILGLLGGKFGEAEVQRDDRLFFFFAGHGATRRLSSGRDIGYLVPVESDPENVAADAVSMTELQTAAEGIAAKHVLFVMDSCYSGLGLSRGTAGLSYLKENARRIGRQMLTAGGADQTVADNGPNGHSVFSWAVLQGLDGRGDLNGDGFVTATELAAYVAPAVANVSPQTPAFGSLPGSEGGEFVLELPVEQEYLSGDSKQLAPTVLAFDQKMREPGADLSPGSSKAPPGQDAGAVRVMVKTLEGGESSIAAGRPIPLLPSAMAERANARGLRFYREQRYAEAEAAFTEALRLRPDFAHAANNLGFIYYKQGKNEEAARWFENTIRMDPSRAIAYYNLGDAYVNLGEKAKARRAYGTYLELAPQSPNAPRIKELLGQL